jgi:hypothetical protein
VSSERRAADIYPFCTVKLVITPSNPDQRRRNGEHWKKDFVYKINNKIYSTIISIDKSKILTALKSFLFSVRPLL